MFSCSFAFSQHMGCDQSTITVNRIFYPNSTAVDTNVNVGFDVVYLCGPNTIVYDTLFPYCRQVLLSPNTKYISNSQGCAFADFIYAKSTSTVILRADGNPGTFRVIYEPGAVIIDQTNSAITTTCNAISFPNISCSVGFSHKESKNTNNISISPNPSHNYIMIKGVSQNEIFYTVITDMEGRVLYNERLVTNNSVSHLNVDLMDGMYLVTIQNIKHETVIKKLVINN